MDSNNVTANQLVGVPAYGTMPAGQVAGSVLSGDSVVAYVGRNRCEANNDTCKGPKAKGANYCVGHLRSRGEL